MRERKNARNPSITSSNPRRESGDFLEERKSVWKPSLVYSSRNIRFGTGSLGQEDDDYDDSDDDDDYNDDDVRQQGYFLIKELHMDNSPKEKSAPMTRKTTTMTTTLARGEKRR